MTFLEAAHAILQRERKPLHYKDLTERAITKKMLTFVGRTPEVTMQTQLTAAVKKAPGSPFVRVKPGVFGLLRYPEGAPEPEPEPEMSPGQPQPDAIAARPGGEDGQTESGGAGRGRRRRRRGGRGSSRGGDPQRAPTAGSEGVAVSPGDEGHDVPDEPSLGQMSAAARAAALAETGVLEGDDDADDAPEGGRVNGESDRSDDEDSSEDGDEEDMAASSADRSAPPGAADEELGQARRRRRRRRRRGGSSGMSGSSFGPPTSEDAERERSPHGPAADSHEDHAAASGAGESAARSSESDGGSGSGGGSGAGGSDVVAVAEPPAREATGDPAAPADAGPPSASRGPSADASGDGGAVRRIMTPVDAAIEILRQQPPGRGVHVRQIADAAVRRRLIHGEPNEAWRVVRAALAAEPRERLRAGQRPRVRAAGAGLFALSRRPPDVDLERAEHVFGEARRALRERTVAALERRLAELPASAFEALARVLLQREGFGPTTFVKRVEGTIYVEALRGRGSRPSRSLIALRSGGGSAGRRAIGELRVGVRARNQDEGVLMLAGRLADDGIAEWKQAGAPVEIADGPALAETCMRHGVGVVNATVSVDFVDADFFAELAEG